MLTKDDLQAIGQLIDQRLDTKLEPINKQLTGMDKRFESLEQKLDQSIKDHTEFFHETWKRIDEIKDSHEKRIEIIEETLGLDEHPRN